jgi:uncharacterized repeat protein (TIGR03803 family)
MIRVNDWKQVCAVFVFAIASGIALPAQTFTTLYSLRGADGANPYTGLVQGIDGNFYGTTIDGGSFGGGNVFKITPGGKLKSLYDFCSQSNCADGQYPVTVLAQGTDGNFYGTTQSGGTLGLGTIFKISPAGVLTTLHSFSGADGIAPYGSLVLATNGLFYGTTNVGGSNCVNGGGCGTVFQISPAGVLTTLYSFCAQSGCADGQYPVGPLIQGSDGNIYGTTHAGGSYAACNVDGCGTVFKMTLSGTLTTLHTFAVTDGEYPYGGVISGPNGVYYGTAAAGGTGLSGTVFEMTSKGAFSTLHNFDGTDGADPYAILLGSDGNLYGTTEAGGANGEQGTVFELTPGGTLTTLHSFDGFDGKNIYSGLVQGTNGILYGTTYFGGTYNDGTVFSLSMGLSPFVETLPSAGRVGATIRILGNDLTGASSVTFNGTEANFKVASANLIVATVPSGATTGTLQVSGSGFTRSTVVPFTVEP